MQRNNSDIIRHNLPVFYLVDACRALWFMTSVWVAYELQYITLSQLTLIEAFILAITLTMQLPTGAFADIFGKKKAMITGCILFIVAILLYSYARSFSAFLIYAVFMGVAQSFIDGTREALLYDTYKQGGREEKFSFIASKLNMVFQISLAAATLIGGWIGSFSYLYVIRMTAGAFILAMIGSFFYQEPTIDSEKFTLKNYIIKTKSGVKELFKNPYVKKISLFYIAIGSLTWISSIALNMVLLTEMKFSTTEIGIAVAAGRILNSTVLFSLIRKGSFFTRKRTFLLLPVIVIATFLPAVLLSKWFVLIPVIGAMFVSSARWNLLSRYTNAEFESKNRATAISALCMAIGIIYVIVIGSSGFIMQNFGGARTMYTLLGIIALFTALPLGIHLAKNHAD
jgi:MFS family permease